MNRPAHIRRGAVIPLFAILTPVIILVCGLTVNVAYMHLIRTELRIATDAAARAGGRAFNEFQSVDQAIQYAASTAELNTVGGRPLLLDPAEASDNIEFGLALRTNNGTGRFDFTEKSRSAVRQNLTRANSLRVNASKSESSLSGSVVLLFAGFGPFHDFEPIATSVATQTERDIVLVVDISGSMAWEVDDYSQYYTMENGEKVWNNTAKMTEFLEWESDYATYESSSPPTAAVPRHSRWAALRNALDPFFTVLNSTPSRELTSLVTFSSDANLIYTPTSNYTAMRDYLWQLRPDGKTYIAAGMNCAVPALTTHAAARPYAEKTIVVLTDGINTTGANLPIAVAQSIVTDHPITIHTITFSANADQSTMQQVAEIGGGKHYHADTAAELAKAFREIAHNIPTILTN